MPPPPATLVRYVRRLAAPARHGPESDAALLARFARERDEAAFAALAARHGPMVLGVCRHVLRDAHDAEDCAQAAFLVLARKAASLRRPQALAAWLHGVALRVARKARADARRRRGEASAARPEPADPRPNPPDALAARELLRLLDEEIARLPEAYRLPVLLCCREGRTQQEAAGLLGWTAGSVRGRLERGRKRLHARLVRRGLTLAAAAGAVEAAHGVASAAVAAALARAMTNAATRYTVGKAAVAGVVSARAVALAERVVKGMSMTKLKIVSAFLLALLAVGSGVGVMLQAVQAQPPAVPAPAAPAGGGADHLKDTLAALDKSLWDALARGDVDPVRKLYGDDFVSFSERGRYDKKDAEESVRLFRSSELKIRDVELVRVSKETAILSYVYSVKLLSRGGELQADWTDHRTSRCWTQRDSGWVLVFVQDQTLPGGE